MTVTMCKAATTVNSMHDGLRADADCTNLVDRIANVQQVF